MRLSNVVPLFLLCFLVSFAKSKTVKHSPQDTSSSVAVDAENVRTLGKNYGSVKVEKKKKRKKDGHETMKAQFDEDGHTDYFEGDILASYDTIFQAYGEDVAETCAKLKMVDKTHGRDLSLRTNRTYLWEERVADRVQIPLTFIGFTERQVRKVWNAVSDLEEAAHGVIEFTNHTNESDYLLIGNGYGCSSYVGRQGGEQILNLNSYGCLEHGTIQHEILHALGFWHEQSRIDRDDYVKIIYDNIRNGAEVQFSKQVESRSLGSSYSYDSLLHYSALAFSKNGLDTIDAKGNTVGQREEAHETDIQQLILLYQCVSGPRNLTSYEDDQCTEDCKCWAGAEGCNGDDDACRGDFVCDNNTCTEETNLTRRRLRGL